jgi:protein O-GlcNAc transferase
VTNNLEEYQALALKLATDGELLGSIRGKLNANRATAPLFDPGRLCRHVETAYQIMTERSQRGKPPTGFSIPPMAPASGG